MVCTADDLQGWKDFPKGLRVLLLDRDSRSTTEIRSRLEEMEYVGESFQTLLFILLKCILLQILFLSFLLSSSTFKYICLSLDVNNMYIFI